jgi:NADH-quinone oxidoreductase subunit A
MGFQFGAVLAFAVVAIGFAAGVLTAFRLIRPHFPEPDKAMIYECGEKPIGQAWFNFNPRFYLIALVFVIFEVDIAITFPVVAVYREWVQSSPEMGWIAFGELFLFTAILVVGLVWVWVHGDLEWVKKVNTVEPFARKGDQSGTPKSRAA